MKCQILFSRKNKKNITNLSSAESAHREVNIKDGFICGKQCGPRSDAAFCGHLIWVCTDCSDCLSHYLL